MREYIKEMTQDAEALTDYSKWLVVGFRTNAKGTNLSCVMRAFNGANYSAVAGVECVSVFIPVSMSAAIADVGLYDVIRVRRDQSTGRIWRVEVNPA